MDNELLATLFGAFLFSWVTGYALGFKFLMFKKATESI